MSSLTRCRRPDRCHGTGGASDGPGCTRRRPRKWTCHARDFTDHQRAARSICRFLAGDGDDAVPDDRGTAADADLGDLAVLLAGSGVEQLGRSMATP
jgi:hypothetical protein